MTEEREPTTDEPTDVSLPEDAVEDLEPDEEESRDISGGSFKQGFPHET
jgi:hypothetical protein